MNSFQRFRSTPCLAVKLTRVHRDGVTIECALRHELTNSAGVAHGGVAAAMADVAVGMAINRHFGGKRKITTVEMKINYFRPRQRRSHLCPISPSSSGFNSGHRKRRSDRHKE